MSDSIIEYWPKNTFFYCNLIKETIIAAKKTIPLAETKKSSEKKDKVDKAKTVAEIDRDKLEKKFSKKKEEKLN